MGILDLKTNLKSLRYGKDRPFGGSSNQPYIKGDIDVKDSEVGRTGGPDFLLRGGTLVPRKVANDVSRMTQMLVDTQSPNGPLFVAKQNLLSRTAIPADGKGDILNNGIYLPFPTILQPAGNTIGLHLNKQLGQTTYLEVTSNPTYKSKLEDFTTSKINTKTASTELFNYQGGPGSILGIGKTIISLSKDRTGLNNPNLNYTTGSFKLGSSYTPSKYISTTDKSNITLDLQTKLGTTPKFISLYPETESSITDKWSNNNVGTNQKDKYRPDKYNSPTEDTPSIQEDFRTITDPSIKRIDYTRKNIEQRVSLGNPGKKKSKSQSARYSTGLGALDKINSYPLYKSETIDESKTSLGNELNDLVKFRIGIIDNNSPNKKTYIHFRAFIDSMTDNYSSEWSSDKLMGRGEKFYRYNGFDRTISLSWTVAAQSKEELIPQYQKLNYLASSLTPDYSNLGYMRGNLATLTVGGYIYEQTGIITGMSLEVPNESPWEIGLSDTGGTDPSVKELPHMIKVSGFNFIPIHEFVPRLQQNKYDGNGGLVSAFGRERYIALSKGIVDEVGKGGNNNYGLVEGGQADAPNYIRK